MILAILKSTLTTGKGEFAVILVYIKGLLSSINVFDCVTSALYKKKWCKFCLVEIIMQLKCNK